MPAAAKQAVARSGEVPAHLCPCSAASCAGEPSLPSEAKKRSLAHYFFPLQLVHPLMILFPAGVCIIFLYFGPVQLKPGNVDKQSHPSGGDVTGATVGTSNPTISSSKGTTGDAPWPGSLKKVSQGLLSALDFTPHPS